MEICDGELRILFGFKENFGKIKFYQHGKYEACNNFENLKLWESRKF